MSRISGVAVLGSRSGQVAPHQSAWRLEWCGDRGPGVAFVPEENGAPEMGAWNDVSTVARRPRACTVADRARSATARGTGALAVRRRMIPASPAVFPTQALRLKKSPPPPRRRSTTRIIRSVLVSMTSMLTDAGPMPLSGCEHRDRRTYTTAKLDCRADAAKSVIRFPSRTLRLHTARCFRSRPIAGSPHRG